MAKALGAAIVALAGCVLMPAGAQGQSCSTDNTLPAVTQTCNSRLHEALLLQPGIGLAATSGNPVAGASSTLGMRIGSVPRFSLTLRGTVAHTEAADAGSITALGLDAAVGIFSGIRLLPTIGGFFSLDAIGSVGTVRLPDKVSGDDPGTWAVGARLGLLRESFTAPGISVTGSYRRIGRVAGFATDGSSYALTDNSVTSIRGVIGKRLFVLGAAAGIGYDRYRSDIDVAAVISGPGLGGSSFGADEFTTSRTLLFGNISWTMLVLNLVAEAGWQEGGDPFAGPLRVGQRSRTEQGNAYGTLAIRLAL